MQTVPLGSTGLTVSRLGFGGAPAGLTNYLGPYDPRRPADRAPVVAAIRRALELGITYFDTAPGYGDGASEAIFGEALADAGPDVVVATKLGPWADAPARASVEASLTRLRRPVLDVLQLHGTAYTAPQIDLILRPGGLLDQMERLRDEGLVRHLGFTVESPNAACHQLLATGRFAVVQTIYNLLFQHAYDPGWKCGLMYDAEAAGMGIVTMRSTTSGIFQRWVRRANPHDRFDYTPALLQFVLANPLVDVALVGMRTPAEVESNVRTHDDAAGRMDLAELFRRYV